MDLARDGAWTCVLGFCFGMGAVMVKTDRETVEALAWRVHESKAGKDVRAEAFSTLRALLTERDQLKAENKRLREVIRNKAMQATTKQHDPEEAAILLNREELLFQRDCEIVAARAALEDKS